MQLRTHTQLRVSDMYTLCL